MAGIKKIGTTGSVGGIEVTNDNTDEILEGLDDAITKALTIIGIKAEKFAKALCPVGTPKSTGKKGYRGGTLRNSITFDVDPEEHVLAVGSNVEYAPYVELGTGPNFKAPPDWEQFDTPPASGVGHGYVKPRPFLRPAIEDHMNTYGNIIKKTLS